MNYESIKDHYESTLAANPNNPIKQVDWNESINTSIRYKTLADSCKGKVGDSVLDFGSGVGMLTDYLPFYKKFNNSYLGIDISLKMVAAAQGLHPLWDFKCQDILKEPLTRRFTTIVANGTFTERRGLSQDQMTDFVFRCASHLWDHTDRCLIFNIMDAHKIAEDKQRKELYFLTYDQIFNIFIDKLKPRKWSIENIGMNDVFLRMHK